MKIKEFLEDYIDFIVFYFFIMTIISLIVFFDNAVKISTENIIYLNALVLVSFLVFLLQQFLPCLCTTYFTRSVFGVCVFSRSARRHPGLPSTSTACAASARSTSPGPRWSERPTTLLPMILANIKNFEPSTASGTIEQGRQEAWKKEEQELLERLRAQPDGERKAEETERMIRYASGRSSGTGSIRSTAWSVGVRVQQALLDEAERLVQADVLREKEAIFFLTFQGLHDVVRTKQVDDELIRRRKGGESGHIERSRHPGCSHRTARPSPERTDATTCQPVRWSACRFLPGPSTGRARVILDMAEADLEPGDILVTAHTDPSWSPLFLAITTGLVTEVGGLMTHGAVIAREYGLPAVVKEVKNRHAADPGWAAVTVWNGTDGYIEILPRDVTN